MELANKRHEVVEITLDGDLVPYAMRGQKMRINSKTPYRISPYVQTAKYDGKNIKAGQKYYLWDYKWEPMKEVPKEATMDGKLAMLEAWKNLNKPKQMDLTKI